MTDGRHGADVSVPMAVPQASWVPTAPVPRSLQLATDDGGEDITVSWKSFTPGERLYRITFFIIWCTVFFGGFGSLLLLLVISVAEIGFGELAVVFYPCLAVLVYGGLLLNIRDHIWPRRHTLTVTFEAVQYSRRSYSPGCLLAVAACLGGNGARTVTETVPRYGLLELDTTTTLDRQWTKYQIMLNSSDGGIMELTLHDKKTQHWLHMLLQNWRNSGSVGVPLVLASLNSPAVFASAPPAPAAVVLV
jgi:hypothetical protein